MAGKRIPPLQVCVWCKAPIGRAWKPRPCARCRRELPPFRAPRPSRDQGA